MSFKPNQKAVVIGLLVSLTMLSACESGCVGAALIRSQTHQGTAAIEATGRVTVAHVGMSWPVIPGRDLAYDGQAPGGIGTVFGTAIPPLEAGASGGPIRDAEGRLIAIIVGAGGRLVRGEWVATAAPPTDVTVPIHGRYAAFPGGFCQEGAAVLFWTPPMPAIPNVP